MCTAGSYTRGFFGKVNSKIDPLGARLATGDTTKMDPLGLKRSNTTAPVQTGAGSTMLTVPADAQANARPRNGTMLGA